MASRDGTLGHLYSCCDAIYRSLGEAAPKFTNDTFVVRLHGAARSFGSLALLMRTHLNEPAPPPLTIIEAVLNRATTSDASGATSLYAMIAVVGPRLLVTLRDARAASGDDHDLHDLIDVAAQATVRELHLLAEVSHYEFDGDDVARQATARNLVEMCEVAGHADSWGLSR